MKKNFFYFAFAAVAAISLTACSSDDDSNDGGSTTPTVNLPRPANAGNAAVYTLAGGGVTSSTTVQGEEHAPVLNSLEVTESEQVLFQITEVDNRPFYVIDRPTVVGNTFTFNSDKVKGTIQRIERVAATRQGMVEYALILSLTIYHAGNPIEFKTSPEGVPATKQPTPAASTNDNAMTCLVRTWNILGATLDLIDLSKNETYYMEFASKNGMFDMHEVLVEAKKREVSFSAKEEEDLTRKIVSITLTQSKNFVVAYNEGADDVATWNWANTEKTAFTIKLKEGSSGNKFINDDTRIETAFSGNMCNMMMKIKFDDNSNKKWDASLLLKLQSN